MALKNLLSDLENGLNAYPNHNTPSTSGGFNYGESTTRIFDSKNFRQKTFEFGKDNAFDRPGEEFSREPFIKSPLGGSTTGSDGLDSALDFVDAFTDGLVRGGIATAVERSVKDVVRIGKFYLSYRGINFLTKQIGLQASQPAIEVGAVKFLGKEFNNNRVYNLGVNTLLQAGVNFSGVRFDRAGISPIWKDEHKYGKYILRNLDSSGESYANTVGGSNANDSDSWELNGDGNRLLTLHNIHVLGNPGNTPPGESLLYSYQGGPDSIYGIGKTRIYKGAKTDYEEGNASTIHTQNRTNQIPNIQKLNLSPQRDKLDESVNFGIDKTTTKDGKPDFPVVNQFVLNSTLITYRNIGLPISNFIYIRQSDSDNIPDNIYEDLPDELKLPTKEGVSGVGNGLGITFSGFYAPPSIRFGEGKDSEKSDTDPQKNHNIRLSNTPNIKNFLITRGKPGFNYTRSTDDGNNRYFIREQRINTGNPGVGTTANAGWRKNGNLREDKYIQQFNADGTLNYNVYDPQRVDKKNMIDIFQTSGINDVYGIRDLIRFRFEAVNTEDPNTSDVIAFRAFLDDFSDQFTANHNEFKYNGRGEPFYTYDSFNRSITLAFKIAAQTRHEMMPLYRKLNYLVSNTAPEYSLFGRMRTPYMRLTVGAWCDRLPGVLKGVNLKWQKDYPWEISIDSPEKGQDTHMLVLPHVLDVSVTYQPIHNFLPEKFVENDDGSRTLSPFILPHTNNRKLKDSQKWYDIPITPLNESGNPDVATAQGLGVERLAEKYSDGNVVIPEKGPFLPSSEDDEN